MSTARGDPAVIENSMCIHEEDSSLLSKHTDSRHSAANCEYGFYHIFTLDGTYKLEMKLTGMLSCLRPLESALPLEAQVAAGLTAHNHQHNLFLAAIGSTGGVAREPTPYGNAFYCKKTSLETALEAATTYSSATSRSWNIINHGRLNFATKRPFRYKILNGNSPVLLENPSSVVYHRDVLARKSLYR
ncbi:hypothetical protein QIS74_04376 [Colletotrichum tabaci]|uniref:Amine oxidase n=1 Tax=Colletotrichum tabaci TaxID=1209068 RepID=A0AAV9TIE8_9PEZI